MRIVSWNINSVRLRLPLIARAIKEIAPDVLCLQETKVEDQFFPRAELEALGFAHLCYAGEKSYNGVAVLSKYPLGDVQTSDYLDGQRRHIAATLPDGTRLDNVYVPAGGDIPDPDQNPKFAQKLTFMDRLTDWSSSAIHANAPHILLGDMNIAPYEHDVWSHKQLLDVVSHTPVEVEKMERLREAAGWIDVARHFTPMKEKLYSWWSYRAQDWAKSDRGRRLDHIWITPVLLPRLKSYTVFRDARGWDKPSDHVPVIMELAA